MHIPTEQRQTNNWNSQSRMIAIVAMLLFALAGLVSGFTVGAFIRPGQRTQPPGQGQTLTPPPANPTAIPTHIPHTEHPIPLGYPVSEHVISSELANDNTIYNTTIQVTDQSNGAQAPGKPVHAPGITCKIWLTKDGNVSANMPKGRLKAVDALSQPFPKEEVNALDFFDLATPQTQMCNAKGRASWSYKVATSVQPGTYFLVALTDWNGVHYNWSWEQITISQ
ncbi:MAG TPA: hypothetical protein VIY29_13180 [Ktedonobacteraceae bacterium]